MNFNNIFIPILSPLFSIILLVGLFHSGKIFVNLLNIDDKISKISDSRYQYTVIGSVILTAIIYPFVLLNIVNIKLFLSFVSITLFLLGLIEIFNFLRSRKINLNIKKILNYNFLLIILILLLYFLLTLAPITNADSLDYHVGVPFYIINNNVYPELKFWTHFLKSGSGEILNAVGFMLKAEQFPSLVQFSGILSISGILLKKKINKKTNVFLLLFLSCPIIVLLASSGKPQLNYIGSSALVFSIIFLSDLKNIKSINLIIFVLILIFASINAKFSFALSASIFWITLSYYSFINKKLRKFILYSILFSLIILVPKIYFKFHVYEMSFFDAIIKPLPTNIYGYGQLYDSLTSCGYKGCFPYWLFVPPNLGTILETLGIGSAIILFVNIKKNFRQNLIFLVVLVYIVLAFKFGQNNPRWFLEVFVWLILLTYNYGLKNNFSYKLFSIGTTIQSFVVILILLYGIFTLSMGSLSQSLREKVLINSANGYELFKWSNSKLNENDVLISTHRSFSLSNVKTIPGDIFYYINIKDRRSQIHFDEIKKINPTHILFYDDKKNYNKLEMCLGKLLYYKKNVGKFTARNPFNKRQKYYDGYIYEFNNEKLPNCIYDVKKK